MAHQFVKTRWSLVLAAGAGTEDSQKALEELFRIYWYPVYSFIRRRRRGDAEAAHDLTQELFTRLLERRDLETARSERGRFRAWLLQMAKHLLANDWDHRTALKRDERLALSLDADDSGARYGLEPKHEVDPERLYHRNWALALIEGALTRLQQDCAESGKHAVFEQVKGLLIGPEGELPTYAPHAQALGMRADTLKVEVHRLRSRLGQILREEVGDLVESPDEIASEITFLLDALAVPRA